MAGKPLVNNTKTKILETARNLVMKNGFENLRIRDVCKYTGVSIGAFYHYFKSKEELMNESFIIYDETLQFNLKNYSKKEPLVALKNILMDQTSFVISLPKKLIIEYYKTILSSDEKNAVNTKRTYYKAVYSYVSVAQKQGLLASNYSITYITEFLIKFVRGNIIDWCLHDFRYNILQQTEKEINMIIKLFTSL